MRSASRNRAVLEAPAHDNGRKSDFVAPWAAGLFEGEGCIAISRSRSRSGRWQWSLACVVQMGDREPLARLQAEWGGRIYGVAYKAPRKDMHVWRLTARQAAAFLVAIQPYIAAERIARKVAVAVAFQGQKKNTGRWPAPSYLAEQERYFQEMRALNVRGKQAA